jgi:hypothetical protein
MNMACFARDMLSNMDAEIGLARQVARMFARHRLQVSKMQLKMNEYKLFNTLM